MINSSILSAPPMTASPSRIEIQAQDPGLLDPPRVLNKVFHTPVIHRVGPTYRLPDNCTSPGMEGSGRCVTVTLTHHGSHDKRTSSA